MKNSLAKTALVAAATFLASCGNGEQPGMRAGSPPLMTWPDLTSRPLPSPTHTFRYADHAAGVVDVWLPAGPGPHPVIVMVHGGCWQKAIADRTLMNYAAEDLRRRGLAVWNIEYRGVDEAGGGYPGTFLDVAAAIDALATAPAGWNLDRGRVAAFGHSAGGHLAAWASASDLLPEGSALIVPRAVALDSVLISGGLVDLEASAPVTLKTCLSDIRPQLVGPASDERPDVFADTSLARLVPVSAEHVSVHAAQDRIAPVSLGQEYTAMVLAAGGKARFAEVPGGHVELIAPGTEAWDRQAAILEALVRTRR